MRSRNRSPYRSMLSSTRLVSIRSVPNPSTMPNLATPSSYIRLGSLHTIHRGNRNFNSPISTNQVFTAPYPAGHMTTVPASHPHAWLPFSDEHPSGNHPRPTDPLIPMQLLDIHI